MLWELFRKSAEILCSRAISGGRLALGSSLAFMAFPSSASAQPVDLGCTPLAGSREIRSGMCVRSTIGPDDPKTANGSPYEDWRLHLEQNETVQIDVDAIAPPAPANAQQGSFNAFAFDAYLELRREGVAEPIARNDDRPGSLNSRIRFTAPAAGDYIVRAGPLGIGEGDYTLRVIPPPPPPVTVPLAIGTISARIDANSPSNEAMQGFRSAFFSFLAAAGDRVRLSATSSRQGVILNLAGPDDRTILQAQEMERSASLIAILPSSGEYRLRVDVPAASEPTEISVGFDKRSVAPEAPPQRLRTGQTVAGELSLGSNVSQDPYGSELRFSLNQLYAIPVAAGYALTVTLQSNAFDPVLDAGAMSALGFATAASNDDGGGGSSSRLVLRPAASGTVLLRVRSVGGRGLGSFRLDVRSGEIPLEAGPSPQE